MRIVFGKEKPANVNELPSPANKAWNFAAKKDSDLVCKEVYSPEIDPLLVIESEKYESRMDINDPPSIQCSGIEEYEFLNGTTRVRKKCGVIFRRYALKLRDAIHKPDPVALLQEAAQIILRMESRMRAAQEDGSEDSSFSHGFVTPKLLFIDEGTELLTLAGLNIKRLSMLVGTEVWNDLVRPDIYTLAFRTPEKLDLPTEKLDLLDDIYSLCLSILCECDPNAREKPFGIEWNMLASRKDAIAKIRGMTEDVRKKWIDSAVTKALVNIRKSDTDNRKAEKFRQIMEKALNRDITRRYLSVSAFATDCFRCGEPLSKEKVLADLRRLNIPDKYLSPLMTLKAWMLGGNNPSSKPIFITGPTGSGKTYLARKIHKFLCDSSDSNFVRVDGAELSLTENLVNSILFGHKRGAFSDAYEDRGGKVDLANNGTLLFDEIQDMGPEIQAILKKMLDWPHEYEALRSDIKKYARCVLIFCTNRSVEDLLLEKRINQDFLERISKIRIEIPPVQERKEKFKNYIISHFENLLAINARQFDDSLSQQLLKATIDPEALELMADAPNPGNFRTGEMYAWQAVVTILEKIMNGNGSTKGTAPSFSIDDARKIIELPCIQNNLQKSSIEYEPRERNNPPDATAVLQKLALVLRKNCCDNKPLSVQRLSIVTVIDDAIDLLKSGYKTISRPWVNTNVVTPIIRGLIIEGKLTPQQIQAEYGLDSFDCELLKVWGRERKRK
jgi:adenylate kinase family enzyme